jgi:hypothetical protein
MAGPFVGAARRRCAAVGPGEQKGQGGVSGSEQLSHDLHFQSMEQRIFAFVIPLPQVGALRQILGSV